MGPTPQFLLLPSRSAASTGVGYLLMPRFGFCSLSKNSLSTEAIPEISGDPEGIRPYLMIGGLVIYSSLRLFKGTATGLPEDPGGQASCPCSRGPPAQAWVSLASLQPRQSVPVPLPSGSAGTLHGNGGLQNFQQTEQGMLRGVSRAVTCR